MLSKKLKEISSVKAKLAALEQQVTKQREAALAALHRDFGFGSVEELIAALRGLGKGKAPAKRGRKKKAVGRPRKAVAKKAAAAPKAAKKGAPKKRKRAKITPALRNAIIASVKAGKTGAAVAKEHGVSLPTVQNIKRDAGLTKTRGK